jgi:hypothetical protein
MIQEENRIFRFLWRFNALAIAVAASIGTLAALVALYVVIDGLMRNRAVYQSIRTDPAPIIKDVVQLGRPESVAGTDFIAYPAMREQTSQGAAFYKKDSSGNQINMYFVNKKTGAGQWLLKDNQRLILSSQWLLAGDPANNSDHKMPTAAGIYVIVENDSNKDEVLNTADLSTLAVSNPDGSGYAVLLSDIDDIQTFQQISEKMVVVSYKKSQQQILEAFDFSTKASIWRKEVNTSIAQ